jgi:TRAP-type C4-dicarboxylate transport system substrate-binding protein
MLTRAAAAALALAWTLQAACAAEVTVRFGSANQKGTPVYDEALEPFARGLEADLGGRLAVDLRPLGGWGPPSDLLRKLEAGELDAVSVVPGYYAGRFQRTSVMELPFMARSAAEATRALWSLYGSGALGDDYAGMKVLALYAVAPFTLFLADPDVSSLKGARGQAVRVSSPTLALTLSRLGVVPVGMPFEMIGQALDTGHLDGAALGWDQVATLGGTGGRKLADQMPVQVDLALGTPTLLVAMNKAFYERLPADMRAAVDARAGLPFSMLNADLRDRHEATARSALERKVAVVAVSGQERAEAAARMEPVYADWQARMARLRVDGAALLQAARAAVGK